MKYNLVFWTLLFCTQGACTQNIEKIIVKPTDSIAGYYLAIKPQAVDIQGVLVLLDGFGGQAEFITGKTGYRSNGMRHPHSWSIVDEVECIQWVLKILK